MRNRQILKLELSGNLLLGDYPHDLGNLWQILQDPEFDFSSNKELRLTIDAQWFDPTILSLLAQMIEHASQSFERITLVFTGLPPDKIPAKMRFLWRAGFWTAIRANAEGSNVIVTPDPWPHRPQEQMALASNHTSLMSYVIGDHGSLIEEAVKDWDHQLASMVVAPPLSKKDLLFTKEYLYLVLWELFFNSEIHSQGTRVSLFGQLFLSDVDLALVQTWYTKLASSSEPLSNDRVIYTDSLVKQLTASRESEKTLPVPAQRQQWLHNQKESYLLISCIDNGVGIPSTINSRLDLAVSDEEALNIAFRGDVSTRHLASGTFDVHGLSQILRLVQNYGGYLFMQSGASVGETDKHGHLRTRRIRNDMILPGALCQILLPLSCLLPQHKPTQIHISTQPPPSGIDIPDVSRGVLRVADELGAEGLRQIKDPSSWEQYCEGLFLHARNSDVPILYVDLIRIPRHRQFISYILRFMRRARLLKGMVVINASPEIAGAVQSLLRLDSDQIKDTSVEFAELEKDIAYAFSRGQLSGGLPLLLPFTSNDDRPDNYDFLWLGLSSISSPWREGVAHVLNSLFHQDGAVMSWEDVSTLGCEHMPTDSGDREEFLSVFHGVCQGNPYLIRRNKKGCWLEITKWGIHITAASSIEKAFIDHTVFEAQHHPLARQKGFLYCMPWHTPDKRFRERYYQTWNVLANSKHLEITAQHLLRKAYEVLGTDLFVTKAIVSVTPSAGLLARRFAKALRIDFWETGSLHDIRAEEWLPDLSEKAVLIVDDVIDTGTVTRCILEHLLKQKCEKVVGVAAMLGNADYSPDLPEDLKLIIGQNVSLGQPTPDSITRATKDGAYFEIDSHTLEPIPPRSDLRSKEVAEKFLTQITPLVEAGAFRQGHLVQSGHHYGIYFSLGHALQDPSMRQKLIQWVEDEVAAIAKRAKTERVTIIYPYYSPIHMLVDAILLRYPDAILRGILVQFMIAKPVQLTGSRMGYIIHSQSNHWDPKTCKAALFLDDGIATGGTLTSVIDGLLDTEISEIAALVVFDRIGLQPRRHLRQLQSYKGRSEDGRKSKRPVSFRYRSYLPVNVPSFFRENCPQCRVLEVLARLPDEPGLIGTNVEALIKLFRCTVVGFCASYEPSFANPDDLSKVLLFYNTILSDKTSPREIRGSISKQENSPLVKLDKLLIALRDRKLFRQVAAESFLEEEIIAAIADSRVSEEARVRFILSLTSIADLEFASDLFRVVLPRAFTQLAEVAAGSSNASLDSYFARHLLEFAAIGAAISSLYSGSHEESEVENWLAYWRCALLETTPGSWQSVFGVELERLLLPSKERKAASVKYLVNNFLGSFRKHKDSLERRILQFRQALRNDDPSFAIEIMPSSLFHTFTTYLKLTVEVFVPNGFSRKELEQLAELYESVEKGKIPSDYENVLDTLVLTKRADCPAKLRTMLFKAAPNIREVMQELEQEACRRHGEDAEIKFDFSSDLDGLGVLFGRDLLMRIMHDFIDNAAEWKSKKKLDSHYTVKIFVSAKKTHDSEKVLFEVEDNNPSDIEEVNVSWYQGGGLSTGKYLAEKCGAKIASKKLPDGKTAYHLIAQTVKITQEM